MKILKKRYPLGTIPGQQTDGRYINETLNENIKLLAKNITKDMTYLGIITSSTLEVGTGKSVFSQQIIEAYLEYVKQYHKFDNKISMNNIVFRPKDIIERSFKVPRYSSVICDEWEDAHYWSELGTTLRQFFRKCRQLNLFILIIIPNFFQLPMSYAISRSVFLVDVKFTGEFDRGYFSFYNFQKKKSLFIKGKKTQDYDCIKPNFTGRFVDGYVVNREEYLKEKMADLLSQDDIDKKPEFNPLQQKIEIFYKAYCKLKGTITIARLSDAFGVTSRTGDRWISQIRELKKKSQNTIQDIASDITINPTGMDDLSTETKDKEQIIPIIKEVER